MHRTRRRQICHARFGDKGNAANVGSVPYEGVDYPWLAEQVSAERVRVYLGSAIRGAVERFELPSMGALNFILHEALDGGPVAP